jgi:hypothetical protein
VVLFVLVFTETGANIICLLLVLFFSIFILFVFFAPVGVLTRVRKVVDKNGISWVFSFNLLESSTAVRNSTAQTVILGQIRIHLSHSPIEGFGNSSISRSLERPFLVRIPCRLRDIHFNSNTWDAAHIFRINR